MEFEFRWYFMIQIIMAFVLFYASYKAVVVHKLKKKFWNIILILIAICIIYMPVRFDYGVGKYEYQNTGIQKTEDGYKKVPPKIEDKTFEQKSESVKGISKDDIWKP